MTTRTYDDNNSGATKNLILAFVICLSIVVALIAVNTDNSHAYKHGLSALALRVFCDPNRADI
jgi:hypothetical protein